MPHRFPASIAAPARGEGRLWLTGARVLDGTGGPVRDGAAVLVEDGVIRRVGSASEPCRDGARLLDLGQRTLMPGLIEAHTHVLSDTPPTLRGAEPFLPGTPAHFLQAGLRASLRMGVTTIRFTGAQAEWAQEARQAMRYGAFRGPRVLTCGKIISATAPGGRFYGNHVPGGGRPRRHAARGPRADPGRGRLHQDHDHRRPVKRDGGPRPAPGDRGRRRSSRFRAPGHPST